MKTGGRTWVSGSFELRQTFGKIGVGKMGAGAFLDPSDWTDLALGYFQGVGIRSDGTLWNILSVRPGPQTDSPVPSRIGDDADWQSVEPGHPYLLALKTDGTLWKLPTETNGKPAPTVGSPTRLGVDSDWVSIHAHERFFAATKRDGSVWTWGDRPKKDQLSYNTVFQEEPVRWEEGNGDLNLTRQQTWFWNSMALRADGTLWHSTFKFPANSYQAIRHPLRIGDDTTWTSFAPAKGGSVAIALKADGSLWKIDLRRMAAVNPADVTIEPVRLGKHSDWVAVAGTWDWLLALAADGSIWQWDSRNPNDLSLILAPSRKPVRLAGIFE